MISLNIMSQSDAKSASYTLVEKTAMISIVNMNDEKPHFNQSDNLIGVLPLSFDDVSSEENFKMEKEDGEKIWEFLSVVLPKIDRLIIHCEYGVSRSAGIAAAILKALTGSDFEIFNNPKYVPNMHCYRMTLNALLDENGNSVLGYQDIKFSVL